MSIDARIESVREGDDPALFLVPRDPSVGPAGQRMLRVTNRPCPPLRGLVGMYVWGDDSKLMIGSTTVAKREGYTSIRLIEGQIPRPSPLYGVPAAEKNDFLPALDLEVGTPGSSKLEEWKDNNVAFVHKSPQPGDPEETVRLTVGGLDDGGPDYCVFRGPTEHCIEILERCVEALKRKKASE